MSGPAKTVRQQRCPNDPDSWRTSELISEEVGGVRLLLRRYEASAQRKGAALLVHGASASSDTFLIPNGGLVRYLRGAGWEVWTLDWRGSCEVVGDLPEHYLPTPNGDLKSECALFTVDEVAEGDIPWAVKRIREKLGHAPPIVIVGHCFGSGALAVSVARRKIEDMNVTNVVFSTLALFYEVTWNGWVKAEDFVIERTLGEIAGDGELIRAIDPVLDRRRPGDATGPARPWPEDMETAYEVWPKAWLPPGHARGDEIFKRLTFMFGQPYLRDRLAPGIHGPLLEKLFGGMHLGLYLHAGQMVRRGFAGRLDQLDLIDRSRLSKRAPALPRGGDLQAAGFLNKKITLLTGAQNQLWHRDSIDLMHEWLLANWLEEGRPCQRPEKRVFPEAAHQDLLWSKEAETEAERGFTQDASGLRGVYWFIAKSLEP